MKPISLAMLALFVFAPFLLMLNIRSDFLIKTLEVRQHYDTAIDNAISDASYVLANSVRMGPENTLETGLQADSHEAVVAFYDSLSKGLGTVDISASEERLHAHVPVLITVGNKGATLYVHGTYVNSQNKTVVGQVILPERPYQYIPEDGRPILWFTMGTDVYYYDPSVLELRKTHYDSLIEVYPELAGNEGFETIKLSAITNTVQALLTEGMIFSGTSPEFIPDFAQEVFPLSRNGDTYYWNTIKSSTFSRFSLPKTDNASYRRAISDIGILAYIKDLPVGGNRSYSTFAFGAGRVAVRRGVVGFLWDSRLLYCDSDSLLFADVSAQSSFNSDTMVFFSSAQEAAAGGYQPFSGIAP